MTPKSSLTCGFKERQCIDQERRPAGSVAPTSRAPTVAGVDESCHFEGCKGRWKFYDRGFLDTELGTFPIAEVACSIGGDAHVRPFLRKEPEPNRSN